MIAECKNHVAGVLKQVGITETYTDPEDLTRHHGLPYAVVLWGNETTERFRRRVGKEDNLATRVRTYRWQLAKRALPLAILIAAKDEPAVEGFATAFLLGLGTRLLDAGGNAVSIAPTGMTVIEDKSLLNQKSALEIRVEFQGGIYRDVTVPIAALSTALILEPEKATS